MSSSGRPAQERQEPESLRPDRSDECADAAARLLDAVRLAQSENPDDGEILWRHKVRACDTLVSLGQERGVSRERIRQREAGLVGKLEACGGQHADALASLVRAELPPFVTSGLVDQRLDALLQPAATPLEDDMRAATAEAATAETVTTEAATAETVTAEIARYMVRSRLRLKTEKSQLITEEGQALRDRLADLIASEADDVGLVNEGVVAEELPDAMPILDELLHSLGFTRVGRHPALRDSYRARAKLGLLQIGRPATKQEVAEKAHLPVRTIGNTLSAIASVGRVDKTRWGLVEWIDEVYTSIPKAIQQRIEAGGGTASKDSLVADIAGRFGVAASSVLSYVSTRQFEVEDKMVSIAEADSIAYRPLAEVASRNERGELYWDFRVEERHLLGFSVLGLPPELAGELGCGPNGRIRVVVATPAGCDPVSVIWRLNSTSRRAEVGRVRAPLRKLAAAGGDTARLSIVDDGSAVRFELAGGDAKPEAAATSQGPASPNG